MIKLAEPMPSRDERRLIPKAFWFLTTPDRKGALPALAEFVEQHVEPWFVLEAET